MQVIRQTYPFRRTLDPIPKGKAYIEIGNDREEKKHSGGKTGKAGHADSTGKLPLDI